MIFSRCRRHCVYNVPMTFDQWLELGIKNSWCGPAVCYTHDGLPMTQAEDDEFNEGSDPCMHILRLYEDVDMKLAVEESHSPSVWRNLRRDPS